MIDCRLERIDLISAASKYADKAFSGNRWMADMFMHELGGAIHEYETFMGKRAKTGFFDSEEVKTEESCFNDVFELSNRSTNALIKAGITTIQELAAKTERDIKGIKNLGNYSLKELREFLKSKGLEFKK